MKHDQQRPRWATLLCTALITSLAAAQAEAQCTPTLAAQQAQFMMSIQGSGDHFGYEVAIDGDWAAVGVYLDHTSAGADAGSVQVYQRTTSGWSHYAFLAASNAQAGDYFGISVAIDGDLIVVGAYAEDPTGALNGGSAYIFELQAGVWTETAVLTAPAPAPSDYFGWDVDVSGNTVIVGVPLWDAPGFADTGSAYVFTLAGGTWTQQAQLNPSVQQSALESGWSVAIEGDTAVIGAPGHHIGGTLDQGSAFVFQRSGNNWNQISNLSSPSGAASDVFGDEVAMGGGRIVIGAHFADDAAGANQGEVTVFSLQFGFWAFEQRLQPSTAAAGDKFGTGIAVDGETILVGAHSVDAVGSDSGAAYVFTFCGGSAPWVEQARVLPWDAHAGDLFGFSVGLSGSTAILGAYGFNGLGSDVGAAYIDELSPGQFTLFGFGDASATPCPCTNDSLSGLGQGCLNSRGVGGVLSAWGSDVAAAGDLTFVAGNLLSGNPALLFAGHSAVAGGAGVIFGDGLRVAGGFIKRLSVRIPDLAGNVSWGPFSMLNGGWTAGQTRYFQAWYRDPIGSPCSSAFNLTNGLQVDFQ